MNADVVRGIVFILLLIIAGIFIYFDYQDRKKRGLW